MERIQSTYLFDPDINADKMIFLSGPRQIGKTTFVLNRLESVGQKHFYYNWDDPYVRRQYMDNPHFLKAPIASAKKRPLIAFDEIHKHRGWKNILKGLYDLHQHEAQFIVTGSARLDFFRQSGDSLVGRYFSYRMLPLGLSEAMGRVEYVIEDENLISGNKEGKLLSALHDVPFREAKEVFDQMMAFGGFPEPFIRASTRFSTRWRRDYKSLLLHEDLRDLTRIADIKGIEQLVLLLPERIGSPLSVNSIREVLQVNHRTVSNWIEALKKIYLVYSILPWSRNISKAIKRETKVYFYDWTMIPEEGPRFENMVAVTLFRLVNRWNELGLGDFDLRYVRNQYGQEVDFLLINYNNPVALFEAKIKDLKPTPAGSYFQKQFQIPYYQIVKECDKAEAWPDMKYAVSAPMILSLMG